MCEYIFLPIKADPVCAKERKDVERVFIRVYGTLNPPLVYNFVSRACRFSAPSFSQRLVKHRRLVLRRRSSWVVPLVSATVEQRANVDLQRIATALAGHVFPGSKACRLSAWRIPRLKSMVVCCEAHRQLRGRVAATTRFKTSQVDCVKTARPQVSSSARSLLHGVVRVRKR